MTILLLELETVRMATIFEAGRRLTWTVPTDVYLINLKEGDHGNWFDCFGGNKADGSRRWIGDYQLFFPAYAYSLFCRGWCWCGVFELSDHTRNAWWCCARSSGYCRRIQRNDAVQDLYLRTSRWAFSRCKAYGRCKYCCCQGWEIVRP